jgi:resuscitation-promoting factor RpfA
VSGTTPDDRELEGLLSEAAGVRQRYRESSLDEPPAQLDEAIRAAARREVSARPRLAGSPFSGSWRIPLSIAAVMLVSTTVTLMVVDRQVHLPGSGDTVRPVPAPRPEAAKERDEPAPPPPMSLPRAASTPKVGRQSAAPAIPAEKGAAVSSDAAIGADRERREQSAASEAQTAEAGTEAKTKAASPAAASRPEPFPAQANNAAPPSTPAASPDQNIVRRDLTQVPPPAAQAAASPTPARDALSTAAVPREAFAPAASSKDEAAQRGVPARPAAPVLQPRARSSSEAVAPAAPAAEESAAAGALLAKKQVAPAKSDSGASANPWEQDPKSWLKHVDELREAGRIEEAKTSFKAFRSRYPDYPLPAGFVVPGP